VHVPLRGRQVLMAGKLLNRASRRAPHRQVRPERVPQDVNPRPHVSRASDARLHHLLGHGRAATVENHALTPEVTMLV
jgi:hypothetical protein